VAEFACVYVSVNDESSMHVVDCEHPGNSYTVPISWIVAPNSYLFTIAISSPSNPPVLPKGSLPVLSTTVVRGVIAATMTASPNPVIVPAGQTTATFTLTWNAPGFSQVDLWGVQNLQSPGQVLFLGSGPSSGTAPEPMSVGEVATLWLYNHGDTTTPLVTLHVTGQH
jgi:hypothetical protein